MTLTVVPLCCPVDSEARPILHNRLQYNVYSGCSWCCDKGLYDQGAMRYPVQENDDPLRKAKSHRKDFDDLKDTEFTTVNWVNGFSVLLTLLTLNMVWGFPIDYLHAELLSVVKYLWDTWLQTKVITADGVRRLNERVDNNSATWNPSSTQTDKKQSKEESFRELLIDSVFFFTSRIYFWRDVWQYRYDI